MTWGPYSNRPSGSNKGKCNWTLAVDWPILASAFFLLLSSIQTVAERVSTAPASVAAQLSLACEHLASRDARWRGLYPCAEFEMNCKPRRDLKSLRSPRCAHHDRLGNLPSWGCQKQGIDSWVQGVRYSPAFRSIDVRPQSVHAASGARFQP